MRQSVAEAIRHHVVLNNWQEIKDKVLLYNDKYEKIIPELFPSRDDKELGLVFIDPSGNKPDLKTLKHITQCEFVID